LTGFDPADLVTKVKDAISKGWQPFGNICVTYGNVKLDPTSGNKNTMLEGVLFTQVVVKS